VTANLLLAATPRDRPHRTPLATDPAVHNMGVNWPHHIFANKQFKVVGAN
jgi:hypothetical protein